MFNADIQELLAKWFLHSSASKYLLSNYSIPGTMVFVTIFNKTDMVLFLTVLSF